MSLEAGSGQNHGFQDEPWLRFGEESRPKREQVESGPHSNMHQTSPLEPWVATQIAAFKGDGVFGSWIWPESWFPG